MSEKESSMGKLCRVIIANDFTNLQRLVIAPLKLAFHSDDARGLYDNHFCDGDLLSKIVSFIYI